MSNYAYFAFNNPTEKQLKAVGCNTNGFQGSIQFSLSDAQFFAWFQQRNRIKSSTKIFEDFDEFQKQCKLHIIKCKLSK